MNKTRAITTSLETKSATKVNRRRSQRGIAMTEYAFLLTFVGVPAIIGFTAGGIILYTSYRTAQVEVWRGSP